MSRVNTLGLAWGAAGLLLGNWLAMAETSTLLGDNQRSGYADVAVPAMPVLQWTYVEKHPPRHAWREPNREVQYIDFDYATQVAMDADSVYFGSSADHTVYALDAATGDPRWKFYTEGPVRFAPVVRDRRVYVASDDGCLYCLDAATGAEVWKVRGGSGDDKLIGNDQMISHWPARSGVLLDGDRLFFTAGMWSRDGVFLYCLDADSGREIWRNDTSGYHFATLPHSTGYAGVSPQGDLALHRGRLYVPTGRGAPAAFDAATGEFLWYENGHGYKPHQPGGSRVMAWQDWVIFKRRSQHTEETVRYEPRDPAPGAASGLYALDWDTGKPQWSLTDKNIVAAKGDNLILAGQGPVIKVDIHDLLQGYQRYWKDGKYVAHDRNIPDAGVDYTNSGPGKLIPNPAWMSPLPFQQWSTDVGRVFVLLCAQDTILAGGREQVSAIDFASGKILWQKPIEGEARGVCVAEGRILVSSTSGRLYCFAEGGADSDRQITHSVQQQPSSAQAQQQAAQILSASGVRAGYAMMLGAGDGQLLNSLIEQSELVVYCLEPDAAKAARVQKRLDDAGLLGVRAAVHAGSFARLPYNPYFANLIVWGEPLGSGTADLNAEGLYRVLRPCGGVAYQLAGSDAAQSTQSFLMGGGVPAEEISASPQGTLVRRGKLPGAGQWTHAQANVARTGSSDDDLVQLPLGMLWWGGPGPERIVSRHWRAPVPVFANGVLYVQGQHDVFAVDAYNGREMWNRHLENVGRFPPTHRGGNIVADDEGVYCIQGLTCIKLDAQTGETVREYTFPITEAHRAAMDTLRVDASNQTPPPHIVWEYLGLAGDCLIGTLGHEEASGGSEQTPHAEFIPQSKFIFAVSKTSGEVLWEHTLARSVSPTAIVADQRAVYLLDRTDGEPYEQARRRGEAEEPASTLKALDLATGKLLWERAGLTPAWKALMLGGGMLVAYPNPAEAQAHDGDKGVGVYASDEGEPAWSKPTLPGIAETGRGGTMRHSFIVGDKLFLPWAYDLHTGKELLLERDPLTGQPKRFDVSGKNFCGSIAAAKDLMVYRSASIGFAPINQDSGSCWLPESRPSCWISAIPAGGMVLAPEGYSTCICPYNYKTSLALIPVERNENWSVYLEGGRREKMTGQAKKKAGKKGAAATGVASAPSVRSLYVNFNAPGDQMDDAGKLWLAWPRPLDPKQVYRIQTVPLEIEGDVQGFRFNSDYHPIAGTQTPWLYTSGLTGPTKFTVTLSDGKPAKYNVTFHFASPAPASAGSRMFNVVVQGKTVISRLDPVQAAGAADTAFVKAIEVVAAQGALTIELIPIGNSQPVINALEIAEQ